MSHADEFKELFEQANEAGRTAALLCVPRPVIFAQAASLTGSEIVPGTEEYVADGVCGFAWVEVRPTVSPFGKWLQANGKGRYDNYCKCISIWISDYNQSMARKEAHADAMAKVLREAGIRAYAGSRMD